ncbi:MAG TPA: hypothetical protein GXX39_03885 [Syntrophothermus lipocalidus]|uniref:DUF4926 domain-containing protein n=1 Tax=Syntrophothermus lipocalidus (strain DSM 12680 / TGB-C1) TaxID=643648 RepID=D7CL75_SYNLT|nr:MULTISPECIES: hypothetical protein [Syntrophothermus]ADI01460.1 conserved hypothetical protein [Syntrophothermus lipocalidus DSM 12680]NSW82164.1 hypothetical protein [Syntrophothermus sp.]HHV76500.1 hypothetical protein [Syntrophothermus lipocalidus]HOV43356.1 hypothetical protein [Syntrophothermus lipocalidus]
MKIGQKVRLVSEFAGLPGGTTGQVVGLEAGGSLVRVMWQIPGREGKKPLFHLFTVEEYQRLLQEV